MANAEKIVSIIIGTAVSAQGHFHAFCDKEPGYVLVKVGNKIIRGRPANSNEFNLTANTA